MKLKIKITNTKSYFLDPLAEILQDGLDTALTFSCEGAQFSSAYMENNWDGKRHMYNRKTRSFPTGLLPLACQAVKQMGHEPDLYNFCVQPKPLGQPFKLSITPWDHQVKALEVLADCPRGIIEAATGSGKCLRGDTLVLSKTGFKELQSLSSERLDDIGSPVRTLLQTPAGFEPTKAFLYQKDKAVLSVTTRYGNELTGTPNHKILVYDEKKGEILRPLGEIRPGDIACISRGKIAYGRGGKKLSMPKIKLPPWCKPVNLPDRMSAEFAEILGHIVAEGVTPRNLTEVLFVCGDAEIMRRYCRLAKKVFSVAPRVTGPDAHLARRGLSHLFNHLGVYGVSKDKQIPACILQGSKEEVLAFLRAYFEGDGGVETAKRTISTTSASKKLISQLQCLLMGMGIMCSIHPTMKCATNGNRIFREYWRLSIYGSHARKFVEEIGFLSSRKKKLAERYILKSARPVNSNFDVVPFSQKYLPAMRPGKMPKHVWDRVKKKNKLHAISYDGLAEYKKYAKLPAELAELFKKHYFYSPIADVRDAGVMDVYDVTMDTNEHLFMSNGFISHNTSIIGMSYMLADCPGFVVTQSKTLLYQLQESISRTLGIPVGILGDGKFEPQNLTIAMGQTLAAAMSKDKKELLRDLKEFEEDDTASEKLIAEKYLDIKNMINQAGYVAIDECHHLAAGTMYKLMNKMENAYYRLGFSATGYGYRTDGKDILVAAALGFPTFKISISDLVFASQPKLVPTNILLYNFQHAKKRFSRKGGYMAFYKENVAENEERNIAIVSAAAALAKANTPVLIAVTRVSHGEILEDMCRVAVGEDSVLFMQGKDKKKTRDKAKQRFKDGNLPILISTILGEGVDMPHLRAVINARAGDSRIGVLQLLGRGMRIDPHDPDKKFSVYIDIMDNGERWLAGQAEERKKIYSQEKAFTVTEHMSMDSLENRIGSLLRPKEE